MQSLSLVRTTPLAVAAIAISCVLVLRDVTYADAQALDAKIDDLRERAAAIRSIDPADEDFSDLAPLAAAIGDARIVQLGESTHGSGGTFAAKVRLVKFLHSELGFDVLLWESGMYDLRIGDDSLRSGFDPAASARLGVFTIWSDSEEVLPLFEYARETHAGNRPLGMAGFDLQFSGRQVGDLELDLLGFIGEIESAAVRDTAMGLARAVIEEFRRFDAVESARSEYVLELRRAGLTTTMLRDSLRVWEETRRESFAPTSPNLDRFLASTDGLLVLFQTRRPELEAAHGEREVAFVERILGNLREFGTSQYEQSFAGRPTDGPEALALRNRAWNRRDARMADNLRWFAETRYPDRKLIVWAHNGHIMNAHYEADWSALAHEPTDGGMKPMGAFLAESLGDGVYTIGFTAYSGDYGLVTMPGSQPIQATHPESLESLLHELENDQSFLDFRGLPPDHWLRQPIIMSIREYMPEVMEDWTRVVDGVFYIDRMTPATRIGGQ